MPTRTRSEVSATRIVGAAGVSSRIDPIKPMRQPANPNVQPAASARPAEPEIIWPATAGMTSRPNTRSTPAIWTDEVTTTPKVP